MLKHIYLRIVNAQKNLNKKINEYNVSNVNEESIRTNKISMLNTKKNLILKKKETIYNENYNNKNNIETEHITERRVNIVKNNYTNEKFILENLFVDISKNKMTKEVDQNEYNVMNKLNKCNINHPSYNINKDTHNNNNNNSNIHLCNNSSDTSIQNKYNERVYHINPHKIHNNLHFILHYSSYQIIKSLNVPYNYINNKDYFMSLSLICNQLAINKYENKNYWYTLSVKLTSILKEKNIHQNFHIRWLALILNSYAKINIVNVNFLKGCSEFIRNYKIRTSENRKDFIIHSFDISQIVNSYTRLNYMDEKLFSYLKKYIEEQIDDMSYQSISNICNAYSKLLNIDKYEDMFFKLSMRIRDNINEFKPQEVANILNSYSKFYNINGVINNNIHIIDNIHDNNNIHVNDNISCNYLKRKKKTFPFVDIYTKAISYILCNYFKFMPIEITMIINAYSRCNIYNNKLFFYLYSYIKKNINNFHGPELSILCNAYANFNKREKKIFDMIRNVLMQKNNINKLEDGNIAMLLHAYAKLLIRDEEFILYLLINKKYVIRYLDSRNLTLFYVSLIKLNIHIPIYIYNIFKYYIKKKLTTFTDLALTSILYSSSTMYPQNYFDIHFISHILFLLNKRKANSKSFCHQMHVSLFVIHSLYNLYTFSLPFLSCIYQLLNVVYYHINKQNYYDIHKSNIQKRIYPFLPKYNVNIQSEVNIGPFIVDFLLLHRNHHAQYLHTHRSFK
ncbi:conserved Plasmodium protein, unknown function [Plasmodium sp. gorilla clade G3]|nr:conserved Plasmodium protein, unknown function [Plasmodium sp. gorilla clade G3]